MYEAVARYLGDLDGLTYSEAAESNIFLNRMPTSPDNAVALYSQASTAPDSKLPYDPVEFQVVVRGGPDGVWALATGRAIYARLHGKRNLVLPDGSYAVFILAQSSSPFSIGDDENGRPQFSWDYRAEQLNPTEERTT